jgi:hypothetical protein
MGEIEDLEQSLNFAPAFAAIFTGAPVIAACRCGSRYIRYRRAGDPGRFMAIVTVRDMAFSSRYETTRLYVRLSEHLAFRARQEARWVRPMTNQRR